MKTTIRDVAEAAGVSAMAVSAVLNGTGRNVKVSAEKAEAIRRIARDLNYEPNSLARSLRNRKTNMIGVVFQHFDRFGDDHPYYPQLLNGVMAALFPAGYTLALCPKLIVDGQAGSISDGRFDGVLWCRPDFDEVSVEAIQRSSVPVVMMHAPPGSVPGLPAFCADNEDAMRLVVRHLRSLGHERLAFVIDPVNEHTAEGRARRDAFVTACQAADLCSTTLVWDEGCEEVSAYAKDDAPHTALVCFSDTLAGQVLQGCQRNGVAVPGDVSIVGFDSSSFCELTKPRLTSVNQPVEYMAYTATTHLLRIIREHREGTTSSPTVSSIYTCGLDVRESTGVPRTHRRVLS
ncbi:MAG TPA: LacI family DNA-binding transcriptional regulator [Fimbriimonas sp.]